MQVTADTAGMWQRSFLIQRNETKFPTGPSATSRSADDVIDSGGSGQQPNDLWCFSSC